MDRFEKKLKKHKKKDKGELKFDQSGFYYEDEFSYSKVLEDFLSKHDIEFTLSTSKYLASCVLRKNVISM